MKTLIENESLIVESKTQGAELTSIRLKSDGTEYLWQGDPKYWARHAPVLFPIVGAVADGRYTYESKQYAMKNHGFARDSEFDLAEYKPSAAVYRLVSDEETYKLYPFKFTLEIGYALRGNALEVRYAVVNGGTKDMYFSIGAHPAFNCPLAPGQAFGDYYLEFEKLETAGRQFVNSANLLVAGRNAPFLPGGRVLPMREGMFDEGAYILAGVRSTSVALKGGDTEKSVTVRFPGFPFLGIWAPPGAPFVCIEPWHGIAESTDFKGDLTQKQGILALRAGGLFESGYQIVVN
jgi:galactose mutarotase-like enzyme